MIPSPRTDLAIHPQDEGVLLGDLVVGQQIALGVQSTAVWHALRDGHTDPVALEAALPHLPRATLRARLAQLAQASVLDDARWRAQRALFDGARVAPAPTAARVQRAPGLRHQCVRCGSSCTGTAVGPVDDATRAGLVQVVPAVSGARDPDDLLTPFGQISLMARRAEACVALDGQGCAVERLAGRAAKPTPCKIFPHLLSWAPDGLRLGLSAECRRLLDCLDAGAALPPESEGADDAEWLELGQAGAFPLPDPVQIAPGVYVPLADFMPRYDALAGHPDPAGAVGAWVAERLAALPALPWLSPDHWGDPPRPDRQVAQHRLWQALAQACAQVAEEAATGGEPWAAERAALVARGAEVLAGDARLPPLSRWGDDHDRLADAVQRGALVGLEPVQRRDVLWGVGRIQVLLALGRAVAGVRAARVGRAGFDAQDFNDGLVAASLTLRTPVLEVALGVHGAAVRWLYASPDGPWRPEYGFLP